MWIWISESVVLRYPTWTTHTVLSLNTFLLFHLYKDGRDFSVLLSVWPCDPLCSTDSINLFHLLSFNSLVKRKKKGSRPWRRDSFTQFPLTKGGVPFNRTTTGPTGRLKHTRSSDDASHPEGPVNNVTRTKNIHYRRLCATSWSDCLYDPRREHLGSFVRWFPELDFLAHSSKG